MLCTRVDADGLLCRVDRAAGSEWRWADSLRPDPIAELFFAAAVSPIKLEYSASRGRCVIAEKALRRGALLLSCPALVLILDGGNNDGAKCCAQLFGRLGFDEPTAALALSALADDGTRRIVRALTRHAEPLIAPGLRDKLRPFLPSSLLNSIDDAELQDLFVAVKENLHRVLDAETASRPIGLGLFPAACLLNHDCQPNACLSFANNGRTLHIRAISDIAAGDEVTCSYLAEEQLYAAWEERSALLRTAFHFEPIEPKERHAAEQAAQQTPVSEATRKRVMAAIAEAQRSAASGGEAAEAATATLLELITTNLEPSVHPFHPLVQEAHVALLALGRTLDEPQLIAKAALHLLTAREATLPVETLHLASLYAAHAGAIGKLIKQGEVPPSERKQAAAAVAGSMRAAERIRVSCLGAEHPLAAATTAARLRAEENAPDPHTRFQQ